MNFGESIKTIGEVVIGWALVLTCVILFDRVQGETTMSEQLSILIIIILIGIFCWIDRDKTKYPTDFDDI